MAPRREGKGGQRTTFFHVLLALGAQMGQDDSKSPPRAPKNPQICPTGLPYIKNKHIENIDRRQYVNGNTNSENNNNRPNNKSNNRANFDSYVQKEPEVLIVMPSSQFKKEVPSGYHHQNDGVSIKQNNDRQISLEDVEQNNSYGDKVVADSLRVPRRIHP